MGYTHRYWACPYYTGDQKTKINCVGARGVTLASREMLYQYAEKYCCSIEGWRKCTLARQLNEELEADGEK